MAREQDVFKSSPPVFIQANHFVYGQGASWFACLKAADRPQELVCYKLFPEILSQKCQYFADALKLHDNSCSLLGTDLAHPFVLPAMVVNADFFCALTVWFGEVAEAEENCSRFWTSVLCVSFLLQAENTEKKALKKLKSFNSEQFTPAAKLSIARDCSVSNWVDASFSALITAPWSEMTTVEAKMLGPSILLLIAQTKGKDDIWEADCCICTRNWPSQWWNAIAPLILHPDEPLLIQELFQKLQAPDMHLSAVCDRCLSSTVTAALSTHGDKLGNFEDNNRTRALAKLKQIIGGVAYDRPPAGFHNCIGDHSAQQQPPQKPAGQGQPPPPPPPPPGPPPGPPPRQPPAPRGPPPART
ncbi:hypothetical protein BDZ89DRAFT_1141206 [Hymenopellis radicata]|nr:hypothetical protein BDZ89DRAFT_1141206 [Hymenopellis radicata]